MKFFLQMAFATMPMWLFGVACILGACSKKPKPPPIYPPHHFQEAGEEKLATVDPNEALLDLEAPTWTIFFDFDSYALREAHKAAAVAEYLKATGRRVFLAGHASEEGTAEYNLALGAQRAIAVRSYLEAAGVAPGQVDWKSFGEESPATTDPDLKHLNRRVEITIERKTP